VKRVRSDTSQVGPTNEQLSEMFFVTKHEWRLRYRKWCKKTLTPLVVEIADRIWQFFLQLLFFSLINNKVKL